MRFESMDWPMGAHISEGRSLTMTQCTSTGDMIYVAPGASLVMQDSRVFSGGDDGVQCYGNVKATRCTIEENIYDGVYVTGQDSSVELVDCVIRKNGDDGVFVTEGKAILRGGTISTAAANASLQLGAAGFFAAGAT